MDKSKEYVLMCDEAEEIQTHNIEWNDLYADECQGLHNVTTRDFTEKSFDNKNQTQAEWLEENCTWLPTQTQLQEILKPDYEDYGCDWVMHLLNDFQVFVNKNNPLFDSFEQYWLAFVMEYKYKKKWNFETRKWIHIH